MAAPALVVKSVIFALLLIALHGNQANGQRNRLQDLFSRISSGRGGGGRNNFSPRETLKNIFQGYRGGRQPTTNFPVKQSAGGTVPVGNSATVSQSAYIAPVQDLI